LSSGERDTRAAVRQRLRYECQPQARRLMRGDAVRSSARAVVRVCRVVRCVAVVRGAQVRGDEQTVVCRSCAVGGMGRGRCAAAGARQRKKVWWKVRERACGRCARKVAKNVAYM